MHYLLENGGLENKTHCQFKEDKVFSMTADLPYGPPVNTDIDYYQTLFYSDFFFVSVAMLVRLYLLGKEKPVFAL